MMGPIIIFMNHLSSLFQVVISVFVEPTTAHVSFMFHFWGFKCGLAMCVSSWCNETLVLYVFMNPTRTKLPIIHILLSQISSPVGNVLLHHDTLWTASVGGRLFPGVSSPDNWAIYNTVFSKCYPPPHPQKKRKKRMKIKKTPTWYHPSILDFLTHHPWGLY